MVLASMLPCYDEWLLVFLTIKCSLYGDHHRKNYGAKKATSRGAGKEASWKEAWVRSREGHGGGFACKSSSL
ncbi:hypothetical protein GOP47_0025901 [Adiantum capillus-veneris]|uniref:Uncharacterized protein n=1 Tax=Adiantum capillus-veneris TaxID=13818 RepID=A0A9D4U1H0_ADICA|nr:hypothetical protein GOP47_0025901 [Adiantum capillus-veneris]